MAPRVTRPPKAGKHTAHYADFVTRFTERENDKRKVKKPETLTVKQRAALRRQLKDVKFLKPDYCDATKINIAGILRKWKAYCQANELGMWKDVIQKLDRPTAMDFLDYMCETWKIRSDGSSWEYWRQLKQLYSSVTGCFIDRNDNREIQNTFNVAYDESIFPTERHRIQLMGCYLLLAFTGARPAEIVDNEKRKPKDGCWKELYGAKNADCEASDDDKAPSDEDSQLLEDLLNQEAAHRGRPKALCYEDISLYIVRHPDTGKDVPAMAIKFTHHKGMDRKPKPSVMSKFTSLVGQG
ncbi:hypothetical protein K4F52_004837 [Lecanicillium sp. MT-2017a]|nr:hypothetical protein K4F52_004837 [Lecanicillium sp. MT-2017a]